MTVCESGSSVLATTLQVLMSFPLFLSTPGLPSQAFTAFSVSSLQLRISKAPLQILPEHQSAMMPFSSNSFIGPIACWFYFRSVGCRAVTTCQESCILTSSMPSLPGEFPSI